MRGALRAGWSCRHGVTPPSATPAVPMFGVKTFAHRPQHISGGRCAKPQTLPLGWKGWVGVFLKPDCLQTPRTPNNNHTQPPPTPPPNHPTPRRGRAGLATSVLPRKPETSAKYTLLARLQTWRKAGQKCCAGFILVARWLPSPAPPFRGLSGFRGGGWVVVARGCGFGRRGCAFGPRGGFGGGGCGSRLRGWFGWSGCFGCNCDCLFLIASPRMPFFLYCPARPGKNCGNNDPASPPTARHISAPRKPHLMQSPAEFAPPNAGAGPPPRGRRAAINKFPCVRLRPRF
jgi:hypothetical protein